MPSILWVVTLFLVSGLFVAVDPVYAQRLQPADLTYRGAFRLPSGVASHGGGTMTFRSDGNGGQGSLLIRGPALTAQVFEASIPTNPSLTGTFASLPQATILQPAANIGGGVFPGCGQCYLDGMNYVAASGSRPAKLFWTWMNYYNVTASDDQPLAASNPTLGSPAPQGRWHIGPAGSSEFHSNKTGGYLTTIPQSVATRFGQATYTLCGGFARFEGAFEGSQGPTLYCMNPWQANNTLYPGGSSVPAIQLLRYHHFQECWQTSSCEFPSYQAPDAWKGVAYVMTGNREAMLFFGTKGLGQAIYTPGQGWHAEPYEYRILFYDVAQLAEVAAGTRQPHTVVPYTHLVAPARFKTPWAPGGGEYGAFGGVGYDSDRQRLYVIEACAGGLCEPAVHVWDVAGGSTPSPPPGSPSGLTVN